MNTIRYSPSEPDHPPDIGRSGAGRAQCQERGVGVRLGELAAAAVGNQPMMVIGGRGKVEELLQKRVRGGGEEKIAAADDVGHALRSVVGDDGEVIGGRRLLPRHDEVAPDGRVGGDVALLSIRARALLAPGERAGKGNRAVGLETERIRCPGCDKAGGLGRLGPDQLAWLADDLKDKAASTPIVVFAHIPLWTIYADWGWGTDDGMQAIQLLKGFGSVTVLNGHIHQIVQKVEGNMVFHTARSTAFLQPAPGKAQGPGPMAVPADQLRSVLGISSVEVRTGDRQLAITDTTLA